MTMADPDAAAMLSKLAGQYFSDLTSNEIDLLSALEEVRADCRAAEIRGCIRGELIRWICITQDAAKKLGPRGIDIGSVSITGLLDLSFARVEFKLRFIDCTFENPIKLDYASLKFLDLSDSMVRGIHARCLRIDDDLFMDGLRAQGRLDLQSVRIGGTLKLDRANLTGEAGTTTLGAVTRDEAILADNISVGAHVLMRRGFIADGLISFKGARIGGSFECMQGTITAPKPTKADWREEALWLENMKVEGHVLLSDRLQVHGCVNLLASEIGGNLECDSSDFFNDGSLTLLAERARIKGNLFLRNGFTAQGRVHLLSAEVGGNFDCSNAKFSCKSDTAVAADGARFDGTVRLVKTTSVGSMTFTSAKVGSSVECSGEFQSGHEPALVFSAATIAGYVVIQNFVAHGRVEFVNARIGSLSICNSELSDEHGTAFAADAASVTHSIQIGPNVVVRGAARMHSAKIGLHFTCGNSRLLNKNRSALMLDGIETGGHLSIDESCAAVGAVSITTANIGTVLDLQADLREASLDLSSTRATAFIDDSKTWPKKDALAIDGFIYQRLLSQPSDATTRLRWIHLQALPHHRSQDRGFRIQPYTQLAKVYRDQGNEDGARKVLIALQDDLLYHGRLKWQSRLGRCLLKITIAYGYKPLRALWFIAAFVLSGYVVFGWAYQLGDIVPTNDTVVSDAKVIPSRPGSFESFCALAYAVDVFVPIIDLGQRTKWHPTIDGSNNEQVLRPQRLSVCLGPPVPAGLHLSGWTVRLFRWIDIAAGWFFTSLFVAGVAGLVRKP